jgi:hypothetical protein
MLGMRAGARRPVRVGVAVAIAAALTLPAATAGAVERPPDTGPTTAGSGIGTPAAMNDPNCDKTAGPYGRLNFITKGSGPVCVVAWKEGKSNGGATYQGVTKDTIKVVSLVPNEQQMAAVIGTQKPQDYATGQPGTVQDVINDGLAGYEHILAPTYTYGRDVEMEYVVSTGSDEAAQRADAIAVKEKKPFVVLDNSTVAAEVFDAAMVAAKIPVFSLYVTVDQTLKGAPYRWGQQDPIAGSMNAAEFIGKQLNGKKAVYAGDTAMHSQPRKFGVVRSDILDIDYFNDAMTKYKVKVSPDATIGYPGSTSTTGDPVVAQEQAPTIVTKLKSAGVTTVILLADGAMTAALTKQATTQDYHPEWIYTGSFNIDFPLLARATYDQDQWSHAFGLSNVWPGSPNAPTTVPNIVQWYWGPGKGTYQITYTNALSWLFNGILYAGPKLTPQTLKQGFFSVPATGGTASSDPALANQTPRSGYGRTNGLPYDEYTRGNKDFALSWYDKDTVGPPTLGFAGGKGTVMYLDNAKRYWAGHWPTKPKTFFDKSISISQFDAPAQPPPLIPCTGCPSETGVGTPSSS